MIFIKHFNLSEAGRRPDAVIVRINHDRKPTMITLSVWKALLLREAVSRLSAGRAACLWLLLDFLGLALHNRFATRRVTQ